MEDIKQISKNSFSQLLVVYTILIAVAFFGLISRFTFHFEVFALILALMGYFVIERNSDVVSSKLHNLIFTLALGLIFLFRAIPYLNNGIPLGYDAGIYKFALEVPFSSIPNWMITGPTMEPFFLYLMKPFTLIFSTQFILTWLFIIFNIILGLSIYCFTKEYFGKRSALIALLIFAVSTVQLITFTYMYYRNIIGLSLMLFAFVFFNKSSILRYRILFILFGGILGAVHRPTFFIFGLSYLFYSLYNYKNLKHNIINGVLILLIFFAFYIGRYWSAVIDMIYPVAGSFTSPGKSPGTFINFYQYQFLTLTYLSFAILGFLYLIKNKKMNILFFWTALNAIIVYFQFFFFNRFIIHLDIALIILAGVSFSVLIESKKRLGLFVLILMLLSCGFLTYKESINARPPISQEDFNLINSLSDKTPSNSIVMSMTSEFSPWLLAYSNREIIAPGLFDNDKWNESQWNVFWSTNETNKTIELMSVYGKDNNIYLYSGIKTFNNTCFNVYLEENQRRLYEYIC